MCFFIGLRFLHGVSTNFLLCPFHSFRLLGGCSKKRKRGMWHVVSGSPSHTRAAAASMQPGATLSTVPCLQLIATKPTTKMVVWWLSKGSLPRFFFFRALPRLVEIIFPIWPDEVQLFSCRSYILVQTNIPIKRYPH